MWVVQVLVAVLFADLVSGLVHWFEDAYVHADMPLLGKWLAKVAEDNRLHHHKPRAFLSKTWWQSSWDLVLLSSLVVAAAWWLQCLNTGVWVFALLTSNANQLHKWTHQNRQEKGALIHTLQQWHLLQTPRAHGRHHGGNRDSDYCVVTNVLNPLLEALRFWKRLEWLIQRVTGVRRLA
jgi:plasmanylethanolamine desaturase